jgi:hypothetical protein
MIRIALIPTNLLAKILKKMYNSIAPLHGEYKEWIGKLSFYNDDLKIMRKWLNDVLERNNSNDFFIELKYFSK